MSLGSEKFILMIHVTATLSWFWYADVPSLDVLDIYIDKRHRVWIIDFDEYDSSSVNSLLFTWEELDAQYASVSSGNEVSFLVVTQDRDKLPYELGSSRGPVDLVEIPNAVQIMMSLANRKTRNDGSSTGSEDSEDEEEGES